jgi:hypothetical protein
VTLQLPPNLAGTVVPTASLSDPWVCSRGLVSRLVGLSPTGDLTLQPSTTSGRSFGPFVYSLTHTAWIPAPTVPAGQSLTAYFPSWNVTWDAAPHVSTRQNGLEILTLATLQLKSLSAPATLIQQNNALLQMDAGPTISLSVEIRRDVIEQAEQEAQHEGLDAQTAIGDTAEALSYDIAVGLEEWSSEFYGVSLMSILQSLYAQADEAIINALDQGLLTDNNSETSSTIAGTDISSTVSPVDVNAIARIAANSAPPGGAINVTPIQETLALQGP